MINSTGDLIERLNITKTIYSQFERGAEQQLSSQLIDEALREVYQRGHLVMAGYIWLNFLLGFGFAFFYQTWLAFAIVGLLSLLAFHLAVYFYPQYFFTRALSGLVLQAFVLLFIYQIGRPEVQYFFFTSFTMLIVYQDERAMWPSVLIFFGQMLFFVLLGAYVNAVPWFGQDYKEFILALVPHLPESQAIDYLSLAFYVGISVLQVTLAGIWANYLRRHTVQEVLFRKKILTKQLEVEKANAELAENVRLKTMDLQEALEASRATEEELRQNMEELQATQDEMENQRQQLLENQQRMEQVEKELRLRQANMERNQWLESNLSHFDDIMRLKYDQPLEEFSEAIIQHLAELIQATQGAFYIYDEEQQSLVMSGGYACTPASVKQKAFKLGEGMLGQVIKTKKTMHIEALPSESVVVESALTRIQSRHLLIMPLLYNEDLQGVIEIALLHPLDALHQDFIQRLSKNLAAMLQSIRGILRTQKLLTQSQEITAQLRENTRELEKTKKEVEQKAIEFQTQFQAIDRSMLVLEYYHDGKIRLANENFRQLVQFDLDELTGKHLSVFLTEAYLQSEEYQNLWPRLFKENYAQAEYAGQTKNGQAFWLRANHYGLKGADPQSDRIMVLAYDITREKEQARKIKEQLRTLAEKEEMMRRNLDIMKELQAEVQHKAAELQAQLQVINLSTAMIEYDNLGYIRYANDKFSQITGYALRELVGQSNKILLDPKFAKSKSYDRLWARLRAKEFVEGEFEFVSKSGHSIWLRGSYYPVLDKNGQVAKVMQLATDISHEMRQEEQIKAHLMDLEITKTQLLDAALALESELRALGSQLGWLVLDAQGKIVKVSQKINEGQFSPLSLAEGTDFKALLAREGTPTNDYQQFWNSLEAQKPAEAQWLSPLLGKEAEMFVEHYLPIANEQGQLQKVIALFLPLPKNGQRRNLQTRKIETNEAR